MKYVIFLLSEASKLDFGGSEKLSKTDHVVIVNVKGKKTISASLQEVLDNMKAEVEFFEVAETADTWMSVTYLMGYHAGCKHDVYVITKDKTKIPNKLVGDAHVYTSFKSFGGTTTTSTAKKTSATKKTTSSTTKKTTTAKKTTTKTTTAKKTTAKKTTAKKKEETSVLDVIGSFVSGDTKKAQGGLADLASQFLGGK